MEIRKVGDYNWRQLSIWEFAPKPSVQKFTRWDSHVAHFYLTRIVEIVNPNHWRIEAVESLDGVPDEVLKCSSIDQIVVVY